MILLTPILALIVNAAALGLAPAPETVPPEPVRIVSELSERDSQPIHLDAVNSKEYTDEWSTAV